jgi:hypothetical protein
MTSHKDRGWLRRILTALGRLLERGILGKASPDYMKQFSGSDEWWDNVLAAQRGRHRQQPVPPDPDRSPCSSDTPTRATPSVRDPDLNPSAPEYEPVHGWTKRQLDGYLARNPGYRPIYEARLYRHSGVAPEVSRPVLDEPPARSPDHDKAAGNPDADAGEQPHESQAGHVCRV